MTAVDDPHVVNINEDDTRLVSTDEVRAFGDRLSDLLQFAELASMRVSRLDSAQELGRLGGWPEGFEFPDEHVAASMLLADVLEHETYRMQEWAATLRKDSAHLWWVRGPGVPDNER